MATLGGSVGEVVGVTVGRNVGGVVGLKVGDAVRTASRAHVMLKHVLVDHSHL